MFVATAPAIYFSSETLCHPKETVYFSCSVTSKRIVSLCGNSLEPKEQFWLQYRFGRPGKLELVYPKDKVLFADSNFQVDYLRHHNGFDIEIGFTNNLWSYTAFYNVPGEAETNSKRGVFVAKERSDPSTALLCSGSPHKLYAPFSSLGQRYSEN